MPTKTKLKVFSYRKVSTLAWVCIPACFLQFKKKRVDFTILQWEHLFHKRRKDCQQGGIKYNLKFQSHSSSVARFAEIWKLCLQFSKQTKKKKTKKKFYTYPWPKPDRDQQAWKATFTCVRAFRELNRIIYTTTCSIMQFRFIGSPPPQKKPTKQIKPKNKGMCSNTIQTSFVQQI